MGFFGGGVDRLTTIVEGSLRAMRCRAEVWNCAGNVDWSRGGVVMRGLGLGRLALE